MARAIREQNENYSLDQKKTACRTIIICYRDVIFFTVQTFLTVQNQIYFHHDRANAYYVTDVSAQKQRRTNNTVVSSLRFLFSPNRDFSVVSVRFSRVNILYLINFCRFEWHIVVHDAFFFFFLSSCTITIQRTYNNTIAKKPIPLFFLRRFRLPTR